MSFISRSASPPSPRRARRSRPRMRRSTRCGSTIPPRSAFRRCARASARHYREAHGCEVDPERIVVTTGSSGGFILAFLSMFEPGDRVAVTVPGYPPYRHILTALGCEPVLIETTASHAACALARGAAGRAPQEAAAGRAGRKPGQSDRHHDDARGADHADRGGGRRGHPLHLRRNLSRARLRVSGRDGGSAVRRRAGDQLVLEIFLHDRLARRLDRRARAAGAADRTAAAEPVDLGADTVADRSRSCVRRPRRDGPRQARLSRRTAAS